MKTTKNVLICEDDPIQLKILSTVLAQEGYRSLATRTPAEALRAARRCGVDAVLTDIQLENGNAFDLVDELRRMGMDAPVFMASAYGTDGMKERARAAGASHFFDKPINLSAVKARMAEALQAPRKPDARMILLENHPTVRAEIGTLAENAGFEVFSIEDGLKALELLLEEVSPIDLLVMDFHSPGLSGGELIRKALECAPAIHIVLMSGDASRDEIRQAYEAGAKCCVRKPVSGELLRNLLKGSLKAARGTRKSLEEVRERKERLANESFARKLERWIKSVLRAPSRSRTGKFLSSLKLGLIGLAAGAIFGLGNRYAAEQEEASLAEASRLLQQLATPAAPRGNPQEPALRSAQASEQLRLMQEANEITRHYYQESLQQARWQDLSRRVQPTFTLGPKADRQ